MPILANTPLPPEPWEATGRAGGGAGGASESAGGSEPSRRTSKSPNTSLTIKASTVFLRRAHPSDSALKQRLLMFRGMPSECSAIIERASELKRSFPV